MDALGEVIDIGERVLVRVDDVVEEVGAQMHRRPQTIPIDVAVLDEQADVDRPEVAHIIGKQGLLAARVRRLVAAELRHRVVGVDRKSTRLNSSHGYISYAVFCLKK